MDYDGQASCATADGLTQEVYALLAQANLCRIRGNWPDAVEKCMAAMRMDPQSVAAHSLLGDIYENKGCLDDAIQWYRMALDINPDSPADQQKLERLLVQKSRVLDRTKPAPAPPPQPPIATTVMPAEEKAGWVRDPFKTLRITAFSSAAVVLAIVIVAMLVSRSHSAGNAAQSQIATPPVVLTSDGLTTTDAGEGRGSLSDVREAADQRLLAGMRADTDLAGHGVTVTDIQSDPRVGRATVSILIAAKDSVSLNRDTVAIAILRAAHSAMRLTDPSTYTDVTVRVLTPVSTDASTISGASLAAIADVSRANQTLLEGDIALMTGAQRQQMLTHPWWSGSVIDSPAS